MTIWLSAGEPSGDRWGAALASALLRREPSVRLVGVAGPRMRASGVVGADIPEGASVMGLLQPVVRLRALVRAYRDALALVRRERPDVAVVIDSPDVHLRFLRHACAMRVPTVYYIPPQVWAWRPGRARLVSQRSSVVVTAFGWERDAFCEWMPGERVLWLGHPLADDLAGSARSTTSSSHLALLPGSRRSEVRTLAPIMVGACQALARSGAAHNAVFAVHDRAAERWVRESVGTPIKIAVGCTGEVLDGASAAVACAGTVTLEAACAGVPTTIVYRTDRLTHSIAKRLVRVDFCGLPNIVLGEAVYPELVQSDLTSAALAETIRRTMSMPDSHWSEQAMRVRNRIANTDLADDGLTVAERVAAAVFTAAAERVPPCAA